MWVRQYDNEEQEPEEQEIDYPDSEVDDPDHHPEVQDLQELPVGFHVDRPYKIFYRDMDQDDAPWWEGEWPQSDWNEDEDNDHDMEDNGPDEESPEEAETKVMNCGICWQSYSLAQYDLSHADHDTAIALSFHVTYRHVCGKHYLCGQCIRQCILVQGETILKQGQGHFPCLECDHHPTVQINTLRDFFTDEEWNRIQVWRNRYQTPIVPHHPYVVPIKPLTEICVPEVNAQLQRILSSSILSCPRCEMDLYKTSACNALRHCDWEICWICGYHAVRIEPDHWKTCSRFDQDRVWHKIHYMCEEGVCFQEDQDCVTISHQEGRERYHELRKACRVVGLYQSLSLPQQQELTSQLSGSVVNQMRHYETLYQTYFT